MSVTGGILGGARLGNYSDNGIRGAPFSGISDLTDGDTASHTGTSGYCGVTLQAPKRLAKAYFRGAADHGFISSGAGTINVTLYGKTGVTPPASGTDGTILGTASFADDNAYHTISSSDNNTQWGFVWIYITVSPSATLLLGWLEFSEAIASGAPFSYAALDPTKHYLGNGGDGRISYDDGYSSVWEHDSAYNGGSCLATVGVSSGKWYWEVQIDILYRWIDIGIAANTVTMAASDGIENSTVAWCWSMGVTGNTYSCSKIHNGSSNSYGNPPHEGDVIGVALNMNVGAIWFAKNNSWQNNASAAEVIAGTTTHAAYSTGIAGLTLYPGFSFGSNNGTDHRAFIRFDPAAFSYTPPTGYLPIQLIGKSRSQSIIIP